LVALPVVVVNVDDDAAHRRRQIIGRPDSVVAAEERLGISQCVGVNQHFVAVEPKPFAVEILRPIDTIGVMSARLEAPEVNVPEKESLVVGRFELNDLDRQDVLLPLKQKQLDARGVSGEDREIYSLLVDSSTQGVG
jgi:hypothetical protein